MIVVEKGGALTTIQDLGRFGFERFGVSPSGPMDVRSFSISNILVGNPRNAAAMEISIMGPTLRFRDSAVIAVTGCEISFMRNGVPLPMYTTVYISAGDIVEFGIAKTGCRAYLAVSGGFDVPAVMGSRATSIQNKIGGIYGRRLQNGDELTIGSSSIKTEQILGRSLPRDNFEGNQFVTLRVIMGPQDNEFTKEGIQTFLESTYKVGNDSNRMGYRLSGPLIQHSGDGNIISDGIVTGSVQIPTSGLPIVMLAERQTVGGYPKIATIISVDISKIGQCRPGDQVRFQAVDIDEAQRLYGAYLEDLDRMECQMKANKPNSSTYSYRVCLEGRTYNVTLKEIQ
ncbi:MAG: biotin-dependent carboxyltransferase family protein [Oscillospiraceae bacterium]|nr:biotin-dependent carboxyltransferase family protein [Oscillospiraceae bacterium]